MELLWDLQIFYNMGGPILRDKGHSQDEKHRRPVCALQCVYTESIYMGIPERHNWSWSRCAKQLTTQPAQCASHARWTLLRQLHKKASAASLEINFLETP